jgi:hypothetical protein
LRGFGRLVVLRTLLPVKMIVLLVIAAGCTKPSYGTKVPAGDAGAEQGGGDDGPGPVDRPSSPAKPPAGDGGKDAGGPSAPFKPDAATETTCVVGVSRIGQCTLH